jgi:diacylglycerol kinase family enzyme
VDGGGGFFVDEVVQLFSNPHAGRHSRAKVAALAKALEAMGARVLLSESADGPPHIAEEATHVCVAGGDGTVRYVAGSVLRQGSSATLSIYPTGTINLLAREAGYPTTPEAFAAFILADADRRKHFPVALGDAHFFACAGVGPDSLAVAQVSKPLKRAIGRMAYAVAILRLLVAWPRHPIRLSTGERQLDCEAFYVAKGRYYAGGWSFAPQARVHEPILHVVALRRARRRDYLRFVARLAAGGDLSRDPNIESFACATLSATAAQALPIQADGDIVGALPAEMTLLEEPLIFA